MNKSVLLPLCKPLYSTYHYQGTGGAVLTKNLSVKNWYLNQVMILSCSRCFLYGYTSPFVTVKDSSCDVNPYLERVWLPMQHLGSDIHRVIRRFLDNGYYAAYRGVDDYYIKGKSWYHERHFKHDGLICGYDQGNGSYTIYAYDQSWVYRAFQTSQRAFEAGRKASFADGHYGQLCGIKVKPDVVKLDPAVICNGLKEYVDSSLDKYPLYNDGLVYGIAVHDYVGMYLNKLADESIPYERMDRRVFRMLWEHKKVMLKRIIAVEDALRLNRAVSAQYTDLVKEADALRMMYAAHHRKPHFSMLPAMKDRLIALRQGEEALLTSLIQKVEGVLRL